MTDKQSLNQIENAMERWLLMRDNDDETLEKIKQILTESGRLKWWDEQI